MTPRPSGFKTQEEYNEYMKNYNWAYRLRDRVKAEQWVKYYAGMQKIKDESLENFRKNAIITGLNFLIDNINFTEDQKKQILECREGMLTIIQNLITEYSQNLDAKIEAEKSPYSERFDAMFDRVLTEFKAKVAADPAFRVKAEQIIRAEANNIGVSAPFLDYTHTFGFKNHGGI
jgi:hypothetical protein